MGILAARDEINLATMKSIPRHFKVTHNCDPTKPRIWGIDEVLTGSRGGNIKKLLAQRETEWIFKLEMVSPKGLNECLSFSPFL